MCNFNFYYICVCVDTCVGMHICSVCEVRGLLLQVGFSLSTVYTV